MADSFASLRAPAVPVDPDPAFAAALKARLARALSLPRGVAVSVPTRPPTARLTPYLAVADARGALAWYATALGGRQSEPPIVMPDGRIGHAAIEVEGALVMLSDAHPEIGVVAPEPGGGATVTLHLELADVDAVSARAVVAGATLERPPTDNPYGRTAVIRDPYGHRWMLMTPPVAVPAADRLRAGDVAYLSLWVPDADRAAAFFAGVLGWEYGAGGQLADRTPPHGIDGGHQHATLFVCLAVDDVSAAVDRVRAAGGQADQPVERPYGIVADCVDDQGTAFALYQRSGDEPRPAMNGTRPGDVSYITLEVVDSARARAFYGAVVGWRFSPGRSRDGWGVDEVGPMTGLAGGHQQATGVPMYLVDDVAAAVERVRAAGGTASDPERQPYGVTSYCSDDQGTRFYLGEV